MKYHRRLFFVLISSITDQIDRPRSLGHPLTDQIDRPRSLGHVLTDL